MSSGQDEFLRIPDALSPYVIESDQELKVEVDVDGKRHTVDLREPRLFEDRLIDDIIETQTDANRSGSNIPIKGKWIALWLQNEDEDYINNIWHNYQFFIKYLEGVTRNIGGIGTYQRSPGTYDSMYRYIIMLEQAGLVERHRREVVPQEEYDMFVPEEFRVRTFVKVITPVNFRESSQLVIKAWENPFEVVYGDEIDEEDIQDIDEPIEPEEIDQEEVEEEDEDITEMVEEEELDLGEPFDSLEELGLSELNANISNFNRLDQLEQFILSYFDDALEIGIEDAPVPTEGVEPEDYRVDTIAIYGEWAESNANAGITPLKIVISIEQVGDIPGLQFIPATVSNTLGNILNNQNPIVEVFPQYSVLGTFEDDFDGYMEQVAESAQEDDEYYDLTAKEFTEI